LVLAGFFIFNPKTGVFALLRFLGDLLIFFIVEDEKIFFRDSDFQK